MKKIVSNNCPTLPAISFHHPNGIKQYRQNMRSQICT